MHIVSNIQYPLLSHDIREVIEKLKTKELEVKARDGEWYNLRIIPYRTLDNFINGAVLTFHRITYLKVLQDKLNLIQRASALLLDAIKHPAVLLDHNGLVLITNNYFLKLIGRKEKEILNKSFMEITGKFKDPKIEKFLKESSEGQLNLEFRHKFPGTKQLADIHLRGTKVMKDKKNGPSVILLTLKLNPGSENAKKPSAKQ